MHIAKVCDECGSDQVSIEAFVGWDATTQQFIVHDMCGKGHTCEVCGGETRLEDIEVPSTPKEALEELEHLADAFVSDWHDDDGKDDESTKECNHADVRMRAAVALLRGFIASVVNVPVDARILK